MSLDVLLRNLKTYEMNIESFKMDGSNKERSLTLKASDFEDSNLDEYQVAFITMNQKILQKEKYKWSKRIK